MSKCVNKLVEFPGHGQFWFHDTDGSGPLVPLDQCDENGELFITNALLSTGYAHVGLDGFIRRHRSIIGDSRVDLTVLRSVDGL